MAEKPRIVVVGAGVSGLTSALQLAQTGLYDVAVVGKHMPGDYDISYASPWAGANYLPVSKAGSVDQEYDRHTWEVLERLTREVPEAGIHFQDALEFFNRPKEGDNAISTWMSEMLAPNGPWYSTLLPNFRMMTADEAKPYELGLKFTSVCINVTVYLSWLVGQLLKHGVSIRRASLGHIAEAKAAHPSGQPADVIVNATGLSSLTLPGIEDRTMYPVRAQIALVRNEPRVMVSTVNGDGCPDDELCYIMQRAAGGGTILGGCYQIGNWNAEVDVEMADRIMQRAVESCPELTSETSLPKGGSMEPGRGVQSLDVIRHAVGLRPCRKEGIRVERETLEGGLVVVHNYGHGGTGYQASWGCAAKVAQLVRQAVDADGA